MPPPEPPWSSNDLWLALPADAGPWGLLDTSGKGEPRFWSFGDAESLGAAIATGAPSLIGWQAGERHLRPLAEIEGVAGAVEARARLDLALDLRRSRGPLAVLLVGTAALVAFWPEDRSLRLALLLLAVLAGVQLWVRGAESAFVAWRGLRRLARDPARWRRASARELRFQLYASRFASRLAMVLSIGFVVVWAAMAYAGSEVAVERLGLVKDRVRGGEWWRLFTCALLHAGPMHFLMNIAAGLSLAGIGRALVDEGRLLLVFVASVLGGSLASLLLMPHKASIGASGGIMGWGGLLLGFALAHPALRDCGLAARLGRWVLLLALIGIAGADFIDNAAHAGGFATGGLLGWRFALDSGRSLPQQTGWPAAVRYAVIGAGALLLGAVLLRLVAR